MGTETRNSNAQHLLKDELLQLDLSNYQVTVCLASYKKNQNIPTFQQIQMKRSLSETFRSIVAYTLEQLRNESDLRLYAYRFDSNPTADTIEYLDLSQPPYDLISTQIKELAQPIVGMPHFRQDPAFLRYVRYYAIVLQPRVEGAAGPFCFFRQYWPRRKLARRGLLAAVSVERGYYDRVEPVDIFLFDEMIDAICWKQTLLVLQKEAMHQMFRFFEALIETVDESTQRLTQHFPITGIQELAKACRRDPRKAARLRGIMQKSYLPRVTMDRLITFIEERKLGIRLENGAIVYEQKSLWQLLRLLNDDFLMSQLTGEYYEVNGKQELK